MGSEDGLLTLPWPFSPLCSLSPGEIVLSPGVPTRCLPLGSPLHSATWISSCFQPLSLPSSEPYAPAHSLSFSLRKWQLYPLATSTRNPGILSTNPSSHTHTTPRVGVSSSKNLLILPLPSILSAWLWSPSPPHGLLLPLHPPQRNQRIF